MIPNYLLTFRNAPESLFEDAEGKPGSLFPNFTSDYELPEKLSFCLLTAGSGNNAYAAAHDVNACFRHLFLTRAHR